MNGLILGIYGMFLMAVGVRGNSDKLLDELNVDAPKFIPWALAIIALVIMAQAPQTEKVVKPFAFLLVLNFVLSNYGNISSEIRKLIEMAGIKTPKTSYMEGTLS